MGHQHMFNPFNLLNRLRFLCCRLGIRDWRMNMPHRFNRQGSCAKRLLRFMTKCAHLFMGWRLLDNNRRNDFLFEHHGIDHLCGCDLRMHLLLLMLSYARRFKSCARLDRPKPPFHLLLCLRLLLLCRCCMLDLR